jgi:hypothetical protein
MPFAVKTLRLFTIFLLIQSSSTAQLKPTKSSGDLATDLKKVILDYPNHFQNIIGETIIENPQSTDYRCTLQVEGAEECYITKYSTSEEERPIYSWQALMLTTENFADAKRKFRSLYEQFNSMMIGTSHLKGTYEAPAEEKKFTNVIFSFVPSEESSRKMKIEVVMENEGMEWKVRIQVYEREREDEEKGGIVE